MECKQHGSPNRSTPANDRAAEQGAQTRQHIQCFLPWPKGSVVQWRWGIQARIGLDIETGEPIRQAWTFTTRHGSETVLYGLLALPHSSTVLRFSESLDQVDMVPAEDTPFDLVSRTLHVVQVSDIIVQVSETSINVATPRGRYDVPLGCLGYLNFTLASKY